MVSDSDTKKNYMLSRDAGRKPYLLGILPISFIFICKNMLSTLHQG
jgi:hypothetical protein